MAENNNEDKNEAEAVNSMAPASVSNKPTPEQTKDPENDKKNDKKNEKKDEKKPKPGNDKAPSDDRLMKSEHPEWFKVDKHKNASPNDKKNEENNESVINIDNKNESQNDNKKVNKKGNQPEGPTPLESAEDAVIKVGRKVAETGAKVMASTMSPSTGAGAGAGAAGGAESNPALVSTGQTVMKIGKVMASAVNSLAKMVGLDVKGMGEDAKNEASPSMSPGKGGSTKDLEEENTPRLTR